MTVQKTKNKNFQLIKIRIEKCGKYYISDLTLHDMKTGSKNYKGAIQPCLQDFNKFLNENDLVMKSIGGGLHVIKALEVSCG